MTHTTKRSEALKETSPIIDWRHPARAVLLLVLATQMACVPQRQYVVERQVYEEAATLVQPQGVERDVAVAAAPLAPGTQPLYLRYRAMRPLSLDPTRDQLVVRAPDSRRARVIGGTLLGIGLACIVAVFGSLAYDIAPRPYTPGHVNDFIPSSLFIGPILGSVGLGLGIPGAVFLGKGTRGRADMRPGRPGFRYLPEPISTVPAPVSPVPAQ